jgi:hypothetical protein
MCKINKKERLKNMKLILDTETISLEKPFVYDLGYTIANDNGEIIAKKSYVITQIWNNKELFATSYYANKKPIYLARLKSKYSKKVSWGNAMRYLANDIKKYGVDSVYAYNGKFDKRALNFMCAWYKVVNGLGVLQVQDIMDFIKPITETENYKNFCVANGYMTNGKEPKCQKKAETLFRYITNNTDFVEEHTGLEDSLIELQILMVALGMN